jgi:tetratricopeptide (TPR) repeat protein
VLSLYDKAMDSDPAEPAYPWNLASSLDRLGVSDLAVAYMRRAIRVAEETGDEEWSGADAYLALADIALRAGDSEIAALAIDNARHLDPDAPVGRFQRQLRRQVGAPEDSPANDYDSARKGAAVEHLIAATCMLASNLELNVSTSLVDDEGVDLVFHRRERSTTLAVQVKSRSWSATTMRAKQRFIAQVRRSTFKPRPDLFMLFVAIDSRLADYGPVWLIPSEAFAATLNGSRADKLRFAASAAPGSDDQWVRYRHERSELPKRLIEELERLEAPR